jgi:hypothetical protein
LQFIYNHIRKSIGFARKPHTQLTDRAGILLYDGDFDHWLSPSSITGENSMAVLSTISDFVRKAQSPFSSSFNKVAEPLALTISLTWRIAVEDTRGGAFDHWLPPSSITGKNSISVLSTISDFVRKAQSPGQIPQNGG